MRGGCGRLFLYAPNVHTGGGLVLLKALVTAWPRGMPLRAWLDERARPLLTLPPNAEVRWVLPRVTSRLSGEFSLARTVSSADCVLCFHGLPPLLPSAGRVEVFQQNRNYFGQVPLSAFSWRTRLRLRFERAVSRWRRKAVHTYWVQTPSMADALSQWWGKKGPGLSVQVLPFVPAPTAGEANSDAETIRYDFVYVADGEAHKNHRRLVEAWIRLADQGFRPSLALTLSARDQALARWIAAQSQEHRLQIHQLGTMTHPKVLQLYRQSRALIFPSLCESFGLPLLEAKALGCPIVASELDFVRDVCEPAQTFDPRSAVSIARAVRRFLERPERPLTPVDAASFLRALGCVEV